MRTTRLKLASKSLCRKTLRDLEQVKFNILAFSLAALLMGLSPKTFSQTPEISTEPNLRVALFGDQGLGSNSVAVLQLIKNEGAAFAIHLGDFDYADNPAGWETQLNQVLGSSFPYFGAVGNHDLPKWSTVGGYQERLQRKLQNIPGAVCTGTLGVNMSCSYRGLFFVLSGVGTLGSGHAAYLKTALAQSHATWEICAWHKNQESMQVGGKVDEVGWEAYETCRKAGAIIATGHEHSYERTKTLIDMIAKKVDPACSTVNTMCLQEGESNGKSFAVVTGLGGVGIRNQLRCTPTIFPYGCNEWANIYTSDQGAQFGVLFVDFNVDGNPNKAHAYFKNIDNVVVDSFDIIKTPPVNPLIPNPPTNLRTAP